MKIISNTIVKNGMPYIGKVLEQVEPFMDMMIITLSEKSNDGTKDVIIDFIKKHPNKIILFSEDVKSQDYLTEERNKQLKYSDSEWILLLDDDDYWPTDQLEGCIKELPNDPDILACQVNPVQLLDKETCNAKWENKKWFPKFLRKDPSLHFVYPWPRDMPVNGTIIHWKYCDKIKNLPYRFYHLANVKDYSFRKKEEWAKWYNRENIRPLKLDKPVDFL